MFAAIVFDHVAKTYAAAGGPVCALDGVVFATEEGEFFGLLGADGTGKATLSSVLAGLTRASAGNDGGSDEACVLRPLQAAECTYRIAFGPRAGQKALTVQGVIPREKDY